MVTDIVIKLTRGLSRPIKIMIGMIILGIIIKDRMENS